MVGGVGGDRRLPVVDGPTEGLDPLMQDAFYDVLADTRRRGRTVFMSSHVLPEVERVCDRIGLLRGGELVLLAPVQDVRSLAGRRVRVTFSADVAAPHLPQGLEPIEMLPRAWQLRATGPLGPLVRLLETMPVADLDVQVPHLEEILRTYYAS